MVIDCDSLNELTDCGSLKTVLPSALEMINSKVSLKLVNAASVPSLAIPCTAIPCAKVTAATINSTSVV
ncbi:MAG: hypothetical protein P8H13_07975 [Polaribacter sp.]|nr:hypothetical protein [Polaribacter sp.]MDG1811861.1 hypothetical protein [Polaribacter sp.]